MERDDTLGVSSWQLYDRTSDDCACDCIAFLHLVTAVIRESTIRRPSFQDVYPVWKNIGSLRFFENFLRKEFLEKLGTN